MNLRCFIAIDIPDSIRQEISALIDSLKKYDADVKWIPAGNLHLTLKFLGSTPESLLHALNESLSGAVASYRPFYITIGDTGVFPNRKHPRICWVGMEEEAGILKTLRADIEDAMSRLGFNPEERDFKPHLTIGRVRSRQGMISVVNELDQYKGRTFGGFTVEHIRIMRSELKPKGAEYTRLYEVPLGRK